MVVDDSRLQRRILSSMLTRWGYQVIEADTGPAALELCQSAMPDMVFSDWMMPEMTGLEFCKTLRNRYPDTYTYFILLTSKAEKNDIAQGLESGADDFLTKPVNASELRARITAGGRILSMQRELQNRNDVISDTLDELRKLYTAIDADLVEAQKIAAIPDPGAPVYHRTLSHQSNFAQFGPCWGRFGRVFPCGSIAPWPVRN